MKTISRTERDLFEALRDIPVIDAHEHLVPESARVSRNVDFFILFSHYTRADFISAGMDPVVYERLKEDDAMPLDEKWNAFSPFYSSIRHGSYARPAQIWVKDVLGHNDLTEDNYQEVSAKLQESNRKGLYDRILREMCNIETALVVNQAYHEEFDMGLLKPLWHVPQYATDTAIRQYLDGPPSGMQRTLEGYLDWVEGEGERLRRCGVYGLKTICFQYQKPDMKEAETLFTDLARDENLQALTPRKTQLLKAVIYDRAFDFARKHGLTVACHSGVWGDFRESHPCHLIPMATAHPDVRFDLFHLGMPFVREALLIGKMFPNVSLNMCWNTIVSPEQTVRMLDECIDMVPLNNVIIFGADYSVSVEKVYGHLIMTKEIVSRALGKRIDRGQMDVEEALRIAKLWFYTNAVQIYSL
ncbi:MAG: amidohydrolase family protein [Planctomycetota bacterium]|jgi:predicted TIM-barrel fold metal-dependent hydrolase|nr:amidohydrolase family protein [Planctomycetota bacterium]MDP7250359.1 amidohydrolase family protein [Planctomycetota bacterium]